MPSSTTTHGRRRAQRTATLNRSPKRSAPAHHGPGQQRSTRKTSALGALSFAAVAALVGMLSVPAYALTTTATTVPEPRVNAQTLSVGAELTQTDLMRDDYQVTRTDLGTYQAYARVDDTFINDPSWAIQWPFVQGVPISSYFGYRSCAGCSSDHRGIDFNPGEGTPIQAIADGTVVTVGGPEGTYGAYVEIEHVINGRRIVSLYAHMLEGSVPLQVGQTVQVGTLVGQVGDTGQSTGPHLHLGIYLDGTSVTGQATDPYAWLSENAG